MIYKNGGIESTGSSLGDQAMGSYDQGAFTEAATDFGIRAGLGAVGIHSPTAVGVLDDAEDGKFNAAKTALSATTEGISKALGVSGGIIGGILGAGYAGITDGLPGVAKSVSRSATSLGGSLIGATLGPIGALVGSIAGSYLGDMASKSFDDGVLGDAFGTRDREDARDRAENRGFSVGDTASGYGVDNAGVQGSGYSGIGPGIGSSGYGLNPGLSDMDGLGRMAEGAFDGGDDNDNGNDTGHDGSGARGSGNEGNSSSGGIGGY